MYQNAGIGQPIKPPMLTVSVEEVEDGNNFLIECLLQLMIGCIIVFLHNSPFLPIRTILRPPVPSKTVVCTSSLHRLPGGAVRRES